MACDVVSHGAPVVIHRSVPLLILDALAGRTTVCEVYIAHAGSSVLRGVDALRAAAQRLKRWAPTGHATSLKSEGVLKRSYWGDAAGGVRSRLFSRRSECRERVSPASKAWHRIRRWAKKSPRER